MQTTIDFLDAAKVKAGAASDYKIAQVLGVTRAQVSRYRSGRDQFSDQMALKVASILEIEPGIVVAACHAEKAKTEDEKTLWRGMFERLGGVAAMLACGIMLSGFYSTESRASTGVEALNQNVSDLYIKRSVRRTERRKNHFLRLLFPLMQHRQAA